MVFECTVGKSLQDADLRFGDRSLLHRFIAVPGVAGIKHNRMTQRYNSREGNPEQHNAVGVNVGGHGTTCAGEPAPLPLYMYIKTLFPVPAFLSAYC